MSSAANPSSDPANPERTLCCLTPDSYKRLAPRDSHRTTIVYLPKNPKKKENYRPCLRFERISSHWHRCRQVRAQLSLLSSQSGSCCHLRQALACFRRMEIEACSLWIERRRFFLSPRSCSPCRRLHRQLRRPGPGSPPVVGGGGEFPQIPNR